MTITAKTDISGLDADQLATEVALMMHGNCGFSELLGMRIIDAGAARAVVSMTLTPHHMNGHGSCHGGVIFALADTSFAHACNAGNIVAVAQQCQVHFLRPGTLGDVLTATASQRTQSGRTGLYDVSVANQHGATIAAFSGMSRSLGIPVIGNETPNKP